MAGELQFSFQSAKTCYFLIRNSVGLVYNGSTFEAYNNTNYATYPVSATEQGASSYYAGTMPSIAAGVYSIEAKQQLGGSPAQTDPTVAAGDIQWDGSSTLPLSNTVTSGQLSQFLPTRISKGRMLQNFPVQLVSSVDHISPVTSGVVSGQISRDGGAFGPLQSGAFSEIGLGWYKVNLTSGDLAADTVALAIQAAGSDMRNISFVTQRTSG